MSPVTTRRRSRSHSDATDLSKASKGSVSRRQTRRSRAESTGEISILSTASSVGKEKEVVGVDENKTNMEVDTKTANASDAVPLEVSEKPAPAMDVVVHRIRCLNFHPKPVIAMKATAKWCKHGLLALSRDNGYVELKSSDEKMRTLSFIPGYRERPVTSLAWIRESCDTNTPLLVGATRDGNIFVVNFAKQSFTGVTSSGGGGVFALESFASIPGCENLVMAGCEDGAVRIFQYTDKGRFVLVSSIPSSGAPVLSLSFRSRHSKGLDGFTVFAAVADGTIRRFDSTEKNEKISWISVNRMTVESLGRNLPTRVWALKSLRDGTLVAANSLGQVQFWDGETGSLKQSIEQTSTKADVLGLAVSEDESKVFASGVDSRVVCIQRQLGAETSDWMLTQAQRPHTHDVRSLEICHHKFIPSNNGQRLHEVEILVTAGLDTKLCTYNVLKYDKKRPRVIYPWPTFSPVFVAGEARIIGISRENKVELYRIHKTEDISEYLQVPEEEMPLGTVQVRHPSNISCAGISQDGKYLVIANMVSAYIFSLSIDKKGGLQTQQVFLDSKVKSSVSALRFLDNNTLLFAGTDGSMTIVFLDKRDDNGKATSVLRKPSSAALISTLFPISGIVTSASGQHLATHRNSLTGGLVEIFSIQDENVRQIWTLPTLDSSIASVSFVDEERVAVTCTDFSLFVFDTKEQRLSQWNQDAEASATLPPELKFRKDFPINIFPHAGSSNKILVVSFAKTPVMTCKDVIPARFPSLCAGLSPLQNEKRHYSPVAATFQVVSV